jgi:hypothetical protein
MQENGEWLRPADLSAVIDTYLASHDSDGRPKGPVTPVVYKYENKGTKKPFSPSSTVSSVRSESKTEHASVDRPNGSDYSSARRCFVCGGPHVKRDCPMRKEGASDHSSGSSARARASTCVHARLYVRARARCESALILEAIEDNPAAKANACAAGQQAANIHDSQLVSPAVHEGVDAQARRCEVRSEVKTPPSLLRVPIARSH